MGNNNNNNNYIKTLKGHTNIVKSVSITNDGKYIVSRSTDNTVRIWRVCTGKLIKIFKRVFYHYSLNL